MNKLSLSIGIAISSLISTTPTYADSIQVYSEATGHYYQRFEFDSITPSEAQLGCQSIKAHLATITSQAEEDFIDQQLMKSMTGLYFIGGSDAAMQGKWKWISGEPWVFQKWSTGGNNGAQPNNRPGEDYLAIGPNEPGTDIAWFDVQASEPVAGYICEWSVNKTVGSTTVPDINGNKAFEIAVLQIDYRNGSYLVLIKDSKTKKLLNTLRFSANKVAPLGVITLKDINGNKTPEIGVLSEWQYQPAVYIKDSKATAASPLIKTIPFLDDTYNPIAVNVVADTNLNGSDEISVLGINSETLEIVTEVRDSKTGKLISTINF